MRITAGRSTWCSAARTNIAGLTRSGVRGYSPPMAKKQPVPKPPIPEPEPEPTPQPEAAPVASKEHLPKRVGFFSNVTKVQE
jgi:hypothetical protein